MENKGPEFNVTCFAPPERSPAKEIAAEAEKIRSNSDLFQLLDSLPILVAIVNRNRQIVFANAALLKFLGAEKPEDVLGQRPGEALQCINSGIMPAGCGTSEYCRACGAVRAICNAQEKDEIDMQECRILRKGGKEALDLRASVKPLPLGGVRFYLVSLLDIGDEKRRRVLEHVFFRDVLNTAGALQGYVERCSALKGEERHPYEKKIIDASTRLVDEVNFQRDIMLAEEGSLPVLPVELKTGNVLSHIGSVFSGHPLAAGRRLVIDENARDVIFSSDRILVQRVVVAMVLNALEATPEGGEVRVACRPENGMVQFSVANAGEMPHDVQLQVFHRSFSTRGKNRGLGCYSMKLVTEQYLHGRLEFTSTEEDGTIFTASYPRLWPG